MLPAILATARTLAQTEGTSSLLDFKTILLVAVTATLLFVTYTMMRMHRRIQILETASPFPKPGEPKPAEKTPVAPQTIAAISAAIHTTLNARHKILAIGELRPDQQAWSLEGRRQVFHSHNVR